MNPVAYLDAMLGEHPDLKPMRHSLVSAFHLLTDCFAAGGKLLLCGNGGSACDCEHIAGELMKGFLLQRPLSPVETEALIQQGTEGVQLADKLQRGLPVVVLSGLTGLSTAFANDVDSALTYAQQAHVYAREGDVLLGISTSGNAYNVRMAAVAARARGAKVIALTGRGGGKLAAVCDLLINVPEGETYRVQEQHLTLYHCLCMMLEAQFYGKEE